MDTLLAVAFANLSSRQPVKILKALRQIEGLLAQICLSSTTTSRQPTTPRNKRSSLALPPPSTSSPQPQPSTQNAPKLQDLHADPAFLEFHRLQDSFQSNIATRLLETLNTILSTKSLSPSTTSNLLQSSLSVLLGLLLLHPPSRLLFARQRNMDILLDILDPRSASPEVLGGTMLVLVAALMGHPRNARMFERAEGLATVVSVFKTQGKGVAVTQEVRFRVLEFLYFYLMPEGPRVGASTQGGQQQSETPDKQSSTVKSDGSGSSSEGSTAGVQGPIRPTEEKQALLGKHLANVEDLVNDLRTNAPFGLTTF